MNWLTQQLTDTTHDITYSNLAQVEFDEKGKPTSSWMKDWTQEERTAKFFEFCNAYDKRQDSLLAENYQQFSHRLHWHECPFVDVVRKYNDPFMILNACLVFSFTNEHWLTFMAWHDGKEEGMKARFDEGERHARSDLFQIYYPKDTDVKEWLLTGPKKAAQAMKDMFDGRSRPYTMMECAKLLNHYFTSEQGFRNAMYPCKNAARHIAMSHPELVDPESFLHGGTGFFDGLSQVMACPNYMNKAKYVIDGYGEYKPLNKAGNDFYESMVYLCDHPNNPIQRQKFLNVEDKLCFFYKHIAIRNGIKQTTKQIPYDWVYPRNWSLRTGEYDA
jgi:hypothetical protein